MTTIDPRTSSTSMSRARVPSHGAPVPELGHLVGAIGEPGEDRPDVGDEDGNTEDAEVMRPRPPAPHTNRHSWWPWRQLRREPCLAGGHLELTLSYVGPRSHRLPLPSSVEWSAKATTNLVLRMTP